MLLSLAVSDVGVSLLGQPLYISLLVNGFQQNIPGCSMYKAFDILVLLFSTASFIGVVAVSVDRFLAIHLHLRYQELVTHKRVGAVVISIWVLSAFLSLMALLDTSRYSHVICMYRYCCWSCSYNGSLHQDLLSRTTPQESDSGPASTTSSTEWRNSKFF